MHRNYQPLHFKFRILVPRLVNFPAFFSFSSFASLSLFVVLFRSFLPLISLFLPLWSFLQVQRVQQSSLHNCKASNSEKIALTWAPGGKRRSGRRRETWRRTVNEEKNTEEIIRNHKGGRMVKNEENWPGLQTMNLKKIRLFKMRKPERSSHFFCFVFLLLFFFYRVCLLLQRETLDYKHVDQEYVKGLQEK